MAICAVLRALLIHLIYVVYLGALFARLGEILEDVPTYKDYWTISAGIFLNLLHLIAQFYLWRFYVHRYHFFIICNKLLHNIRSQSDSDCHAPLQIAPHQPRVFLAMPYSIQVCPTLYYTIQVRHLEQDTLQYRLRHLEWGSNIPSKIF